MKKLISFLKQIRISRVLTVFLVGLLVFVGTAFSSNLQALAKTASDVQEEVPETGATSPYEGGMNLFPDTDPRQDTSDADAKAGSLVKEAEQNASKDYELGAPPSIQNMAKDVGSAAQDADRAAKDTARDISKGAQRGMQNIKESTQKAGKGLFN